MEELFNIQFSMSTCCINYLIKFVLLYCRNLISIFHSGAQRKYMLVSTCDCHWEGVGAWLLIYTQYCINLAFVHVERRLVL